MLTKSELKEIKQELDSSENPLFIFHDDGDGLCSFLLCYRYLKRGHGELIKKLYTLTKDYDYLVRKYKPDKVFVLDIPEIEQEFIDEVNVPVIWIDHHPVQRIKNCKYFNSRFKSPDKNFPVSYLMFKVLETDMWISMIGSVSDYYLPEYKNEFVKKYPDLLSDKIATAGEALYETKLGEIIRLLSFSLKAPKYKIKKTIKKLIEMQDPHEILEFKYPDLLDKYNKLKKAALKTEPEGKFLIFKYEKKAPFIGELANELIHLFPDKIIIVARESKKCVKASIRSRKYKVLSSVKEVLKYVKGKGGGHELACGVSIDVKDWDKFIVKLKDKFK